ncbi:MAG: EAL domain-containing protein [Candidatus Thiodiazotropha sp.]
MSEQGKDKSNAIEKQFMRDRAEEIARSQQRTQFERKLADRDKLLQELHVHQIELELQNEELRQAQARLEYTHQQYLDLYNEAPIGYASLDDKGIIIRANQMLANMLGVEKFTLTGRAIVEYMLPSDQSIFRSRFNAFAKQPDNKHIDITFKQLDGSSPAGDFVGRIRGRRIDKSNETTDAAKWSETLLVVISDVTELKKSEERIHYQAHHDALTGVPNRATLYDQLENSLHLARRQHSYGALLFMDLDRFKNVNDSLGHHAGDQLLKEFTQRLRTHIRREDMLARMGGDEFVVLLAEQHSDKHVMAVKAQRFAEHINESLSEPIAVQEHVFQVSVSIGISIFPFVKDDTMNDVVRQSDTAMYQAKKNGRGLVRFFHMSMQDTARQRMTMEAELRVALIDGQFELYFQPQVTADGELHALEALLRWQHPYRGVVAPDKFIGVAEDTGMIVPLGEWVFEHTVKQIAEWQQSESVAPDVRFAINVSAKQLETASFCEHVEEVLGRYDVSPKYLVLEITESLLIRDDDIAEGVLTRLSDIGLTFSVDDFGTGYSSLATIQNAPIGQLKIDKRFITHLHLHDENDEQAQQDKQSALVNAILSLGKALGLEVVAEGVETEEQSQVLQQLNCRYMQGYLYSKALPADEILKLLSLKAKKHSQ